MRLTINQQILELLKTVKWFSVIKAFNLEIRKLEGSSAHIECPVCKNTCKLNIPLKRDVVPKWCCPCQMKKNEYRCLTFVELFQQILKHETGKHWSKSNTIKEIKLRADKYLKYFETIKYEYLSNQETISAENEARRCKPVGTTKNND